MISATHIKKDKAWDEIYEKLNVTAKHEHKFKLRWRRSNLIFKLGSSWVWILNLNSDLKFGLKFGE